MFQKNILRIIVIFIIMFHWLSSEHEVIKLCSCSMKLSIDISTANETKMLKNKDFSCF